MWLNFTKNRGDTTSLYFPCSQVLGCLQRTLSGIGYFWNKEKRSTLKLKIVPWDQIVDAQYQHYELQTSEDKTGHETDLLYKYTAFKKSSYLVSTVRS